MSFLICALSMYKFSMCKTSLGLDTWRDLPRGLGTSFPLRVTMECREPCTRSAASRSKDGHQNASREMLPVASTPRCPTTPEWAWTSNCNCSSSLLLGIQMRQLYFHELRHGPFVRCRGRVRGAVCAAQRENGVGHSKW